MATAITAEAMLAALAKWGITPKFYKPDWRTHNRNAQQGWGPLYGFVVHNFASDISDDSSLAYLYRGDNSRGMPGPLSQFAITDDGTVWVIGWGAANHTGTVDADLHALVTKDAVSRTVEFKPNTSGSSTAGTVKGGPRYIGVEMTYGAKGPTAAQRASLLKLSTAIAELVGGTGGSVIGHRECTTTRSDPQFVSMTQLRRDVDALLTAGPGRATQAAPSRPAPTPAPAKEPDMQFSDKIPGQNANVGQALARALWAYEQIIEGGSIDRRIDAAVGGLGELRAALAQGNVADAQSILDRIEVSLTVKPDDAPPV